MAGDDSAALSEKVEAVSVEEKEELDPVKKACCSLHAVAKCRGLTPGRRVRSSQAKKDEKARLRAEKVAKAAAKAPAAPPKPKAVRAHAGAGVAFGCCSRAAAPALDAAG